MAVTEVEPTPMRAFLDDRCASAAAVAKRIGLSGEHFRKLVNGKFLGIDRYADALVGVFGEDVREVIARHIEFCGERK